MRELFVTLFSGWKPLTNFKENSVLGISRLLQRWPTIKVCSFFFFFFLSYKLYWFSQGKDKTSSVQFQNLIVLLLSSNSKGLVLVQRNITVMMFKTFTVFKFCVLCGYSLQISNVTWRGMFGPFMLQQLPLALNFIDRTFWHVEMFHLLENNSVFCVYLQNSLRFLNEVLKLLIQVSWHPYSQKLNYLLIHKKQFLVTPYNCITDKFADMIWSWNLQWGYTLIH